MVFSQIRDSVEQIVKVMCKNPAIKVWMGESFFDFLHCCIIIIVSRFCKICFLFFFFFFFFYYYSFFSLTAQPIAFTGQAANHSGKGMRQKEQIATLKKFKEGVYNTLVATCIAEEGLRAWNPEDHNLLQVCFSFLFCIFFHLESQNFFELIALRVSLRSKKRLKSSKNLLFPIDLFQKYKQDIIPWPDTVFNFTFLLNRMVDLIHLYLFCITAWLIWFTYYIFSA